MGKLLHNLLFLSFTTSYRILPHFTETYRIIPLSTASYRILPI